MGHPRGPRALGLTPLRSVLASERTLPVPGQNPALALWAAPDPLVDRPQRERLPLLLVPRVSKSRYVYFLTMTVNRPSVEPINFSVGP